MDSGEPRLPPGSTPWNNQPKKKKKSNHTSLFKKKKKNHAKETFLKKVKLNPKKKKKGGKKKGSASHSWKRKKKKKPNVQLIQKKRKRKNKGINTCSIHGFKNRTKPRIGSWSGWILLKNWKIWEKVHLSGNCWFDQNNRKLVWLNQFCRFCEDALEWSYFVAKCYLSFFLRSGT